mmetsp:Transcript_60522/g.121221  ORF Transcript_60522/g.121221 Transcript_60522/m.121221 type:complete len:87 (+) Transcript_60522:732-992(+)
MAYCYSLSAGCCAGNGLDRGRLENECTRGDLKSTIVEFMGRWSKMLAASERAFDRVVACVPPGHPDPSFRDAKCTKLSCDELATHY